MKALRTYFSKFKLNFTRIRTFFDKYRKKTSVFVDKNPTKSFYIALGILFLLIVASNILGTQKQAVKKEADLVKEVELYVIGTAPTMSVLAKIEKSGVITITALTPGVVQYINPYIGQNVNRGQNLMGLSSNYQGGNTASLTRQLAQLQYENALNTKQLQLEIVGKQKEIAQKADASADDLRNITDKSISETNSLILLNDQIIASLDASINELESTNVAGSNDDLILSTKSLKSQFLSGTNMARQALRIAEFTSSENTSPAILSNLQKDIALKQLELQEKMIALNVEISTIQLQISRVVEGMMYPAAPFEGVVERIFVQVGEAVNPGTPLIVLSGDQIKKPTIAVAYVTGEIARSISKTQESNIHINNSTSFTAYPFYVSREAVNGTLYAVYFSIPSDYTGFVTEGGFIQIELPIGYMGAGSAIPYIPIDSVYQTKDANYIYIDKDGIATSESVELGDVFGSFVEVKKGLQSGDKIIVNRNIIAGDKIMGIGQ